MRKFLLMAAAGMVLAACQGQQGQVRTTPAMTSGGNPGGGCDAEPAPGAGYRMSNTALPAQNPTGGTEAIANPGNTAQRAPLPSAQNAAGGCEALPPGTAGGLPAKPTGR